jgi:hypothetical protein
MAQKSFFHRLRRFSQIILSGGFSICENLRNLWIIISSSKFMESDMADWPYKLDKTVISIGTHAEHKAAERAFWLSKNPQERLQALEFLRQTLYGYDPATARVQRVLRVLELERS